MGKGLRVGSESNLFLSVSSSSNFGSWVEDATGVRAECRWVSWVEDAWGLKPEMDVSADAEVWATGTRFWLRERSAMNLSTYVELHDGSCFTFCCGVVSAVGVSGVVSAVGVSGGVVSGGVVSGGVVSGGGVSGGVMLLGGGGGCFLAVSLLTLLRTFEAM